MTAQRANMNWTVKVPAWMAAAVRDEAQRKGTSRTAVAIDVLTTALAGPPTAEPAAGNRKVQVNYRLPAALREAVSERAAADHTNVPAVFVAALTRHLIGTPSEAMRRRRAEIQTIAEDHR
jgi:hypothetical protein